MTTWSQQRLLRCGHENLTLTECDVLCGGLVAGDVDSQIQLAWIAAQDLRILAGQQPAPCLIMEPPNDASRRSDGNRILRYILRYNRISPDY